VNLRTSPYGKNRAQPPFRRPVRQAVVVAAFAAVSALVLSGCSPVESTAGTVDETLFAGQNLGATAAAADVSVGGTLVFALSNDPGVLDPTFSNAIVGKHIFASMCESLYTVTGDGGFAPVLATEAPTISDDGLTYTIPLREDAVFSDGEPLTAASVVASIERNKTAEGSLRASELAAVERAEATDEYTVVLHLSKVSAPLLSVLADRPGMPLSTNAMAGDFGAAPSCVGPFRYDSSIAQTSVELVKDPNYYDADKVFLDAISFRVITDASVRLANLRSGDVQVADRLPASQAAALLEDKDVELLYSTSLGYQGVHVNLANTNGVGSDPVAVDTTLASDPRVRQAFSMAIDRQTLVDTVFDGAFLPACGPVSPATEYASEATQACPEFDPEAAKALLDEVGIATPVPVTLSVQASEDASRYAQALQSNAADAGFDVTINTLDFATVTSDQKIGNFDATLLGWAGRTDPDGSIAPFFLSTGSQNYTGYHSEEMDALLADSVSTTDIAERTETYAQIVELLQEDNPYIYLYRERNFVGQGTSTAGVITDPTSVVNVSFAGFLK